MIEKPPYFPLYVLDLVGDDAVEAMTTEAFGAYMLLLCKAWHQEPPGTIPNDDSVLARWSRVSPERWQELRQMVFAAFKPCKGGKRLMQKRMVKEYEKLVSKLKVLSEAGRRGALKKHAMRRSDSSQATRVATGHPTGVAIGRLKQPDPDPESKSNTARAQRGAGGKPGKLRRELERQKGVSSVETATVHV